MAPNEQLIYDTVRLLLIRYSSFGSDVAAANIEYRTNLKYHTAAADGKNVFFDPNYLASLNEDDRLFLIAHEIMHNKFKHMLRLIDKNGNKKDLDVWNDATDAIINANLERDGFTIKKGYINRPEALHYTAEEFYEILLKEKQSNQNNRESNSNYHSNENNDQTSDFTDSKGHTGDDHSLWEEAFEKYQENKQKEKKNQIGDNNSQEQEKKCNEFFSSSFDERAEFQKNREHRRALAKENLKRQKEHFLKYIEKEQTDQMNLGNVGESKNSIDWKILLRREIEKSETVWSQRRSIAENNYAYRLEEQDCEDEAETEVLIDISGSVDLDLVKAFLRMLKPILKHSKLRVGCFNEKYWGMVDIKSNSDIDNFTIPALARGSAAWTEDWDLAVRSFTKKREINKIIFTDGIPGPGNMPKEDLKNENVIWLVYGNEKFKPCCGKVINITEDQLERLHFCQNETRGMTK